MNDSEKALLQLLVALQAKMLFQEAHLVALQNAVYFLAIGLGATGINGRPIPEVLFDNVRSDLNKKLADISDDNPNLASELKTLLDEYIANLEHQATNPQRHKRQFCVVVSGPIETEASDWPGLKQANEKEPAGQ